jgi:hypothetical protein
LAALENQEGNVDNIHTKLTYNKEAIKWRRARVLELDSQGYNREEIVAKLHIARGTVTNDLAFLRKQAMNNLEHHIHDVIPYEYEKALRGMKANLKCILEIADTATDPRTKLHARAIINDCYDKIMNLSTNGVVVSDAIKFGNQAQAHINELQRHLDKSESQSITTDIKEDGTTVLKTTNGVF